MRLIATFGIVMMGIYLLICQNVVLMEVFVIIQCFMLPLELCSSSLVCRIRNSYWTIRHIVLTLLSFITLCFVDFIHSNSQSKPEMFRVMSDRIFKLFLRLSFGSKYFLSDFIFQKTF